MAAAAQAAMKLQLTDRLVGLRLTLWAELGEPWSRDATDGLTGRQVM